MNGGSTAARSPSLWLDPAPDPGPPLEGAVEADAVVIGAGYTGLWTALALARARRRRGGAGARLRGLRRQRAQRRPPDPDDRQGPPHAASPVRSRARRRPGALRGGRRRARRGGDLRARDRLRLRRGRERARRRPPRPAPRAREGRRGRPAARRRDADARPLGAGRARPPPLRRLRLPGGARRGAASGQVRAGRCASRRSRRGCGSTSPPRWTRSPTGPGCGWRPRAARRARRCAWSPPTPTRRGSAACAQRWRRSTFRCSPPSRSARSSASGWAGRAARASTPPTRCWRATG